MNIDIYSLLKIVSDPSRLRILSLLRSGPKSVTSLESALNLSQANTSKHLKKLMEFGIVENEVEGRSRIYSLNNDYLRECKIFEPIMTTFQSHKDYQADQGRLKEIINLKGEKNEIN